ncbi:hypothetical protein E8E15_000304 [Penicillium rubens]|nr:hypothetical protein E8E15_000304 [Penicillium rubens]KAJ5051067.1 hypothetical protein NUH16_011035 [Penicillium rubens]
MNTPLDQEQRQDGRRILNSSVRFRSYIEQVSRLGYTDAVQLFRTIASRYDDLLYWDIIIKKAETLDPATLPTPRGPLDEFTRAEKAAAAIFMKDMGCGLSIANQRRCRYLWKRLHEMRKVGVEKILQYRTSGFDELCNRHASHPNYLLVDKVRAWEQICGPYVRLLENHQCAGSRYSSEPGSRVLK